MNSRSANSSGFSLVEVTLALGIAAFCLVSIFGLLSVGVNSNAASIEQTTAVNVLSTIAADVRSVPDPLPKGQQQNTAVYLINVPKALTTGSTATTSGPMSIYVDASGQVAAAAAAQYQLNVWTTPGVGREPTLVRLMLSWPAPAPLANAAGTVESVICLDRN